MRTLAAVSAVLATAFVCGCWRPPPYDGTMDLAHPTMTPNDIASAHETRVRALSEGATGKLGADEHRD